MTNKLDGFVDAYQSEFAYALDNRLILNWYPERITKFANGNSLLELGIGHGFSTNRFSNYFKRHLVIDGSSALIKQFKTSFPDCKAEIIETYFESFETKERFDTIVMGFILEHVDDPKALLLKYKKFLNPSGKIYITVPNAEALNRRLGYEAGLLDSLFNLSEADLALGHQRLFSTQTLTTLIKECGFEATQLEGIFLKPITTQQLISLNLSEDILQSLLKVGVHYPELCVALLIEIKEAGCLEK